MNIRSKIKVNWQNPSAHSFVLSHDFDAHWASASELRPRMYSSLGEHFALFTFTTRSTEITLQLCRAVIKYYAWMTWRTLVDLWMNGWTYDYNVLMLITVCVFVSLTLGLTLSNFICCSVDENVQRPHHAGDGDDVEGDRAHDLPSLARRHL